MTGFHDQLKRKLENQHYHLVHKSKITRLSKINEINTKNKTKLNIQPKIYDFDTFLVRKQMRLRQDEFSSSHQTIYWSGWTHLHPLADTATSGTWYEELIAVIDHGDPGHRRSCWTKRIQFVHTQNTFGTAVG